MVGATGGRWGFHNVVLDRAGRYWSGDRSRLPSPEAQECGMPHSPGPEGARAWLVLQLVKGGSLVFKDVSA